MLYSHRYLCGLVMFASACGLGSGSIVPMRGYSRTTTAGGSCSGISGRVVRCGSTYATSRTSGGEEMEYTTGGGFGAQFAFRRGIGSASAGEASASGTAYDLGLDFILHREYLSYSVEIGLTRQDLSELAEDYRYSAFYVMPRLQKAFGPVALFGGIGYLGMGSLDLPSGYGQEASSVRFAGGLRIGIPLELGWLNGVVLSAEGQRTQALDDIDYAANAALGCVTVMVSP